MNLETLRSRLIRDETTELTAAAHAFVVRSLEAEHRVRRFDDEPQLLEAGGALWIFVGGYVTEARGQSSANGHGKQGCAPERIAALRALPVPARIVFVDQTHHDSAQQRWQAVWLGINEPEVVNIDKDTTHKRQGWWVREMERGVGFVPFPEAAPEPVARAQGALL